MSDTAVKGSPLLEIACFNAESALLAAASGADRIELCKNYPLGGLTPDPSSLTTLKSQLDIPVYVMIRPTSESFCYSSADFEQMKTEIDLFKNLGADGFVFGILYTPSEGGGGDPSRSLVDIARNTELVERADGRPCTFHRAFDLIPESQWETALQDVRDCGFSSILTNGGPSGNAAVECVDKLATLVQWTEQYGTLDTATGHCLPEIIVGGGVRSSNTGMLQAQTRARAFHSAALTGNGEIASADEVRRMSASLKG
ncbi:copper homeostasis CutC domain-containing protein [Aspergillus granulosus]|uniref:Copper homeostasis protein cutC homolog n=1 Tax=Aspergillus granulosus TaxID=176169 RepID=A0ABR4HX62_9EURO